MQATPSGGLMAAVGTRRDKMRNLGPAFLGWEGRPPILCRKLWTAGLLEDVVRGPTLPPLDASLSRLNTQ